MEDKRIVKGIWIPIEIWKDENLSWNEKILLMEIDSFTAKGRDCFFSDEYISQLLGIHKTNANKVLASLIKKGYVVKTKNDGRKRFIAVNYTKSGLAETPSPTWRKDQHNNIDEYKSSTNVEDNIEPRFDFRSSLVSLGVSARIADDWMKVRRTKRATNSQTAFEAVAREIRKSGLSADVCIRIAVENSWSGFKAEWVNSPSRGGLPQRKESVFEHNLRVADQMFGTNYHEQYYGKKENPDEQ